MNKITQIVEHADTRAGRIFDVFIQALIIISLITFSIETLPDLSERSYTVLNFIETAIVILFTFEYIVRVVAAKKKLSYILSFYGIVDLLAILPFYFSTSLNLQSVRILRLIRLFRVLKLARYSAALTRIGRAFLIAREELILFSIISIILLYLSAVGIYHFEHAAQPEKFRSIFDCLWWAVATLTTVGYGDIYPITTGGRIFTFMILMIGLGVVAIPTGIIASALASIRNKHDE